MGYVSQADIHTIGEKQQIMEYAYQLNNIILEVRRYEKNYFLYNSQDALAENAKYLAQAREILTKISVQAERFKISPMLHQLSRILDDYGANFARLSASHPPARQEYQGMIAEVREQGKQMSNLSEELTVFEHYQIQMILETLKGQLVIWSVVASMIGIIMPFVISFKIFKPLNIIKKATEEIAGGRFKTVEVLDTRDEMQQVMEAFNTMVRELELKQDQLVQSKKLSSIGTLTAGVAHQLNNPLNNISTSCQIAIDDFDSGDRELLLRMLKNIEQETLRARDVVKGLLEFSRARQFSRQPAHLLGVVNRAVRLVQSHLSAEILLEVNVPEELVLPLDTLRIQEVFLNLIINAAQSIEDKGKITISATTDPVERMAVIEVRDTGAGIAKEIQERLFDPFYTTKEEGRGTGLGLSIVYGIIQHHRGAISVQSEPGQGAAFIIRLPLDADEKIS